jgi:hypothetical protein
VGAQVLALRVCSIPAQFPGCDVPRLYCGATCGAERSPLPRCLSAVCLPSSARLDALRECGARVSAVCAGAAERLALSVSKCCGGSGVSRVVLLKGASKECF